MMASQKSRQAADPAAPLDGLRGEPGLDGGEQGGIEDRLVASSEGLAAIDHLSDIEPVAQQMREAADPEGNAPNDAAVLQLALLGAEAAVLKVLGQRPHRAKLQVTGEDGAHGFGLRRHDKDFLVRSRIAERDRAADPDPFALRRRDLVAHPFADHLALELGEGQQDVEGEPPDAGRRIERLGDRDEARRSEKIILPSGAAGSAEAIESETARLVKEMNFLFDPVIPAEEAERWLNNMG